MATEQKLDTTFSESTLASPSTSSGTSKRWATFMRERFPLGTYLIMTAGFAVSGSFLSGWDRKAEGVGMALIGLMLFFLELRIMDELKDYKKDLIAHPERPLPRGLITLREAHRAVQFLFRSMVVFAACCVVFCNLISGLFYLGITLYLWLMYREFYLGSKLAEFPLIYAFTHQIILFPLCLFAASVHHPAMIFDEFGFYYAICVFGSFFAYEICRKLDPRANPILKNYLSIYGAWTTALVVWTLLSMAAYGALFLKAQFLWVIEGAVAASLGLILIQPKRFKWVEVLASVSLILHIWASPIQFVLKKLIR